jgi:flavodoxin
MKILVVYYSRTGTTKKVGEEIAKKLGADVEEIIDTVDRNGPKGWLYAGRDAMKKRLTKLKKPKLNPADYDLVIVGTPIWAWNVSAPVRTYLTAFKRKFKKVAFFCTMGSQGAENAFKEMGEVIDKKPVATISLTTKEVVGENYLDEVEAFVATLRAPEK